MAESPTAQRTAEPCDLSVLALGRAAVVQRVLASAQSPGLARRLAELGFFPGEVLRVLAKAPGGDPLVVRIGSSTFALRVHEAACVAVVPQ